MENSNEELLAEPIEAEAQDETDDLKFNFPKSEPLKEESKSSEKESNHGYYVILESVPDEKITDEIKFYCARKNITTTLRIRCRI